ncbi:DNA methyltransferase [Brevibacterium sp. SMBL_HHYL_HB1]|uniref:DNA methyltransferase n=1 Tax=Brevibacterium sp. SMBL_HHYL_HB1 TaxID=2777556 RepID=UPI001BA44350|nr:DNA methyltransferase [Brevibacterium sp. SMBL_HHYL_HB1]QUL80648.1 site-specific DNA-methyltransferase [Brevibacterium sp. SMBL_HHYL_HB1]
MTDILLDGEPAGADLLALEGDNLTSLERLDGIESQAGIVYLDPPYNTGSYDRTYRDAFGSGWEAFMRPRLAASRALLAPTGVLMVSIGEAEHPRLRLMLDEMFGVKNRLATLIWSSGGRNAGRFTSGVDYLLVYARDRRAYEATGHTWRVPRPGVRALLAAGADAWDRHAPDHLAASRALSAWWSKNRGDLPAGLRFYLRIDDSGRVYRTSDPGSRNPANPNRYDILHPTTGRPCRMPVNGWAGPPDTLRAWQKEGRLRFGADHTTTPQYVRYLDEGVVQAPDPVIVSFRQSASKHVAELVGHREVGTPKDHRVLAEWFSIVKSRVFWRLNVRSVIRPPKSAGSCSGLLRSRRESDSQASNATVRC